MFSGTIFSDIIMSAADMVERVMSAAKEQSEILGMLQDGINNRGWKIVKPDDDNGGGGNKPAPVQPKPSGTNKGYAIIQEMIDGFRQNISA
jgi:hypothetical protein